MGFGGGVLLTRRKHSHHLRAASGAAGTQQIRGGPMKEKYDFSRGKRGRIVAAEPEPRGKTRVTIRLDGGLVDYFFKEGKSSGREGWYPTTGEGGLGQRGEGQRREPGRDL